MSEWQPIETAPEATTILCLRGTEYGVDQFEWHTRSEERLVRENVTKKAHLLLCAMKRDEWPGHNHTYVNDLREAIAATTADGEVNG